MRRWRDQELIILTTPVFYMAPIDIKTEHLVSYIRVDLDDIVAMDCVPPVDNEQEELPY